jgi:hypothetical protein
MRKRRRTKVANYSIYSESGISQTIPFAQRLTCRIGKACEDAGIWTREALRADWSDELIAEGHLTTTTLDLGDR